MAGRGSTSFGIGATITILALLALGFFVAFAVFYGRYTDRVKVLEQERSTQAEIIRADERNRDDVRNLIEAAKRSGNQSLVNFLVTTQGEAMRRITGSSSDRLADLPTRLSAVNGANEAALLSLIQARETELRGLQQRLAQAEGDRQAAINDRQTEVGRVQAIEQRHQATVDALNAEVGTLRTEVENFRLETEKYKQAVAGQLDRTRSEGGERERGFQDQIAQLTEQNLILLNQLTALRGDRNTKTLKPGEEAALVDGAIIGTETAERIAYVNIGSSQRVVLGMTFAVYANAGAIRPDESGEYPRGKATLEVISVGESSSTCRITSELKGNPVVRGDVIANAIYDPSKVYKFVAFGNFDTNRDAVATAQERESITSMIRAWGGSIAEDIGGDVDFLVLGERPVLPPRPAATAPLEVVLEFQRRDREIQRYDALYRQAASTSVPILNQNRLFTLIGQTPAGSR